MSTSNNQNEKQFEPWQAKNEFYSLSKVFGLSSKTNYSISYSKENGLIAWLAGPYVILYDLSLDKQISFIKNPNNKILSCLRFNEKGNLLVTGEGNCQKGEVRLYQIFYDKNQNEINIKSILNYKVHKFGIDKVLFIRNDEFILSIGNNEDKTINLTDIKNKHNIFISRYNRNILSCDVHDNFMILCGNKFIKIYNYEQLLNNGNQIRDKNMIEKSHVELGKLKDCSFVSVVIDQNMDINSQIPLNKIFFITYDGYLVEMKSTNLTLSRWVHLKTSKGLSLTIWNNLLGCGCSDGLFRIFSTKLEHVCTLKYPPPLGLINSDKELFYNKNSGYLYADVVASFYNLYYNKLIIIYSDKTLLSWDISDYSNIKLDKSKICHLGGIKAMDYFQDKENNLIKIITCSDDKTVIYWSIPIDEMIEPIINFNQNNFKHKHIFYSKYIQHIFYLGNDINYENFKIKQEDIFSSGINKKEDNDEYNLTSIRFSPCGNYIAIGDNFGNIQIFSLIDFSLVNNIEVHNAEINSIDMINDENNKKIYLSSGSSDCFVSLIDMTQGWINNPINDDKIEMEKMSSPVISLVLCIDKFRQLKLIVGEQDSTITFFLINNGQLQSVQKHHEDNLKIYCLSYSPSIKKIISGHNGKISIWKTSTNISHKQFQVNKGDKLLDNFRIASDNSGLIFATSNDDKYIRIRALHDGKLLAKIQVSESISALFFILEDNYLIASSIEGYLYMYKLNKDLINKMKKENELKNSTEERDMIKNKLLLLQNFMESGDISLSKNNQVKNLLQKFQTSEETTMEDIKNLNSFVKEGKKNLNKKPINLKDDYDEQEDQNNNDNQNNPLSRSNIFEKGLRIGKNINDNNIPKKNFGRTSFTDLKLQFQNNKDKDEDKAKEGGKKINSNEQKIIEDKKGTSDIDNIVNNKFSNINIDKEYSNNNNKYNNLSTRNPEEIKEEIEDNQSSYQAKVINNSLSQISETHMNNLRITKTTNSGIEPFNIRTIKKGFDICKQNDIFIYSKKIEKVLSVDYIDNMELLNKIEPKDKLINSIDNNLINDINDEKDLKEIETCVEKLLGEIRLKLGKEEKDAFMEKMVDKYSKLIMDKINKGNLDNNKKEDEI